MPQPGTRGLLTWARVANILFGGCGGILPRGKPALQARAGEARVDGGVSQGCLHSHRHPVPACVGPGASEASEALSQPAGYEAQTGNHRKVRPGEACAECWGDPEAVALLGLGSISSEAGCTSKEGPFSADRSGLSWGLGAVAEAGLSRLLPCPSPPVKGRSTRMLLLGRCRREKHHGPFQAPRPCFSVPTRPRLRPGGEGAPAANSPP